MGYIYVGVEEVAADMENKKVVIKGKDLNPKKIMEEIKKKYSKNVELISPKDLPDTPKQNKPQPKKEEVIFSFLFFSIHLP